MVEVDERVLEILNSLNRAGYAWISREILEALYSDNSELAVQEPRAFPAVDIMGIERQIVATGAWPPQNFLRGPAQLLFVIEFIEKTFTSVLAYAESSLNHLHEFAVDEVTIINSDQPLTLNAHSLNELRVAVFTLIERMNLLRIDLQQGDGQ